MTAGKRKYQIEILGETTTLNAAGTPASSSFSKAVLRAEIIRQGTEEFIRDSGASDETVIVFRTIWAGEVTPADRVSFGGTVYNLREVVPLGRRHEIELRCVNLNGVG